MTPDQLAIDPTGSRVAAQTDQIGIYDLRGSGPRTGHWLAMRYECSGADDVAFIGTKFVAAFDSCVNLWDAPTCAWSATSSSPAPATPLVGHARILYGTFRR
ncbi:hypothetical protein [Streptomyces sp. NPDC003480]